MIEIDGSYGEGGGQILRSAVALSAITGKPIRIFNIRANRKPPGLKAQHMTGILAAKEICDGKAKNVNIGSLEIEFYPGKIRGGNYYFDIGTAGSLSLLFQTLLPIMIFSEEEIFVKAKGGTDVLHAPSWDYYQYLYFEILRRLGFRIESKLLRRGYYPKGGGLVEVKVYPEKIKKKIDFIEKKEVKGIFGIAHASEELRKRKVAERMIEGAKELIDFEERVEYWRTLSIGCGITIIADLGESLVGFDVLGERGVPAEKVGRKCAEGILKEMSYPVDRFLADHLVLWIGLFGGRFRTSEITNHTRTNIWVCEKILGVEYKIDEEKKIIEVKKSYF